MSDGLAEELLNLLAQGARSEGDRPHLLVRVQGRRTSKIAEIATRLNVAHVLEGSVRTSGNKLRMTAQLIRASDSTHLWSETYDRTLDDIFAVQDEIAAQVVTSLQATLLQTVGEQQKSEDLEAYALYLKGRQLAQQGDNQRGLQYLRRSLEKDPG